MGFLDMLFSGIGSLFSVAVNVVSEVVSTVKTYLTAKEIVANPFDYQQPHQSLRKKNCIKNPVLA